MAWYNKLEEILYKDGAATPTNSVYPTTVVNTGATGGAVAPTSGATGTSGVLYTDGAASTSSAPTDPYGYAEWLKGQSYQNAADTANRARQEAAANKQSAIVGADTAYQQGLSTYGANAESLASRGLSNSGYGEYLMGKNYATARAEKAAANAAYQGAMSDILYQENSAKLEADKVYADEMIRLDEKKKTDAQSAYDSLLLAAQSGTDISALQSDARWALISPEQQNAITAASSDYSRNTADSFVVSAIEAINNGTMTLDDIKAMSGWTTAGTEGQDRIEAAANTYKNNVLLNTKNGIITDMTLKNFENYTDAYLDDMIVAGSLDEAGKNAIKETRAEVAFKSVVDSVKDDPSSVLTTEGFNEFHNQIRYLRDNKFISWDEYEQLFNYAIASRNYREFEGVDATKDGNTIYLEFSDGSEKMKIGTNGPSSAETQEELNATFTSPSVGKVYRKGNNYYTYFGGKWYGISTDNVRNKFSSIAKAATAPRRGNTN